MTDAPVSSPGARVPSEIVTVQLAQPHMLSGIPVRVTEFNMPFMSLVSFLIKVALASIPAMIIVSIIVFVVGSFLLGFLVDLVGGLGR
jgi:hypothetical protein